MASWGPKRPLPVDRWWMPRSGPVCIANAHAKHNTTKKKQQTNTTTEQRRERKKTEKTVECSRLVPSFFFIGSWVGLLGLISLNFSNLSDSIGFWFFFLLLIVNGSGFSGFKSVSMKNHLDLTRFCIRSQVLRVTTEFLPSFRGFTEFRRVFTGF